MSNDTRTSESGALISGIAAAIAGGGVVTLALFPFAVPILILTVVFTAPLLLIGLVAALAAGVLGGVVLALRAIWRRLASRRESGAAPRAPAPPVDRRVVSRTPVG